AQERSAVFGGEDQMNVNRGKRLWHVRRMANPRLSAWSIKKTISCHSSLAQQKADDFFFGACKNMAVGKRGSSPGQFFAAKRISRLHQASPADFLVTLGAEMTQDQFAQFVVDENGTSVDGHVHRCARSAFRARHLICFPDLPARFRVQADQVSLRAQ